MLVPTSVPFLLLFRAENVLNIFVLGETQLTPGVSSFYFCFNLSENQNPECRLTLCPKGCDSLFWNILDCSGSGCWTCTIIHTLDEWTVLGLYVHGSCNRLYKCTYTQASVAFPSEQSFLNGSTMGEGGSTLTRLTVRSDQSNLLLHCWTCRPFIIIIVIN